MIGYVRKTKIEEGTDPQQMASGFDPNPTYAYARITRKMILEIEINDYTDADLRMLEERGCVQVVEPDAKVKSEAKVHADRERAKRTKEESGWSGCPDCGQLPCVCTMEAGDPF